MARYRLLSPHIIAGGVRAAGTEVGDDTDFPFDGDPTPHMEGLDSEGKKNVAAVLKDHFEADGEPRPGFQRIDPPESAPEPNAPVRGSRKKDDADA